MLIGREEYQTKERHIRFNWTLMDKRIMSWSLEYALVEYNLAFYQPLPGNKFECRDGSATLPYSAVNDDYCDCRDSSDEPGTSACSMATFYCQNAGHIAGTIPSSRVNDGVCDPECCDGSDEWNSSIKCPNICQQVEESYRKKLEAQERIRKEGQAQRREYIKLGKKAKVAMIAQIKKLEEELKKDAETLQQLQFAKETAEKAEEAKREAEEQIAKEAQDLYDGLDDECKSKSTSIAATIRAIHHATGGLVKPGPPTGSDGDLEREESDGVASDDGVDSSETTPAFLAQPAALPSVSPDTATLAFSPQPISDSASKRETPYMHPCDDIGTPFTKCLTTTISDSIESLRNSITTPFYWKGWSSLKRSFYKMMGELPSEPPDFSHLSSDVTRARDTYNEFEKKKNEKEQKLRDLKSKAGKDFGPAGEWGSLDGKCFSGDSAEYTYEVCLMDKVLQKQGSGYSIDLGKFSRWGGRDSSALPGNQKYTRMMYEDGLACWNGPARSTEVVIECGAKNAVVSVSEPSKCEYLVYIASPAACVDPSGVEDSFESADHTEMVGVVAEGVDAAVPVFHPDL
ncbi:hypothetical protein SeMB42_g07469 [Synchytrium endobioticum]|uniref:Glucosidase 2 subunit beta n=1 Tax=Synchytrium endobioticum TaxID=286115 RepID=A0A507C1Y9_9FUNG|nr:hypothetical protein SeMB42_g07469 [Synchytrium endobioticum]TPX50197.1 hypothetical protein SeLEV6574_g01031 [Synchytrium endobioticum]